MKTLLWFNQIINLVCKTCIQAGYWKWNAKQMQTINSCCGVLSSLDLKFKWI